MLPFHWKACRRPATYGNMGWLPFFGHFHQFCPRWWSPPPPLLPDVPIRVCGHCPLSLPQFAPRLPATPTRDLTGSIHTSTPILVYMCIYTIQDPSGWEHHILSHPLPQALLRDWEREGHSHWHWTASELESLLVRISLLKFIIYAPRKGIILYLSPTAKWVANSEVALVHLHVCTC